MNMLTSLPAVLSCAILEEWLLFAAIGPVDSAYCCRHRGEFLVLLQEGSFSGRGFRKGYSCDLMTWLQMRKVRMHVFHFQDQLSSLPLDSYTVYLQNLPGLKELYVHNSTVFATNLQLLQQTFPHLQVLSVECKSLAPGVPVAKIISAAKNSLTKASLPTVFWGVPVAVTLTQCSQLRSLALANVTDETIDAITSSCPRICNLDISYSPQVTDTGMQKVFSNLIDLRSISVSVCNSITAASINRLRNQCAHTLEALYVSNTQMRCTTPAEVREMFPKLHKFIWTITTDKRDIPHSQSHCANVLNLYHNLANEAVFMSTVFGPYLEVLVLAYHQVIPFVTTEGLVSLISKCPRLHTIVVKCTAHTARITEVAAIFPQLRVTEDDKDITFDVLTMPI